ncbi:unnamed protein product [Rodentolepis nana]|uniref:CLZ domain-containing protein n=1 Tax=Rodentolepis nana TaxID=102285 RepID=A0A0R3T9H5_RODNA|nr:unnamed protein product [Rodentolepis nana]
MRHFADFSLLKLQSAEVVNDPHELISFVSAKLTSRRPQEYSKAREKLMEASQQILRKGNILNEEILCKEKESRETVVEKMDRFDANLEQISIKLARLLGEFGSNQAKNEKKLTHLENQHFETVPLSATVRQQPFPDKKTMSPVECDRCIELH